ncbi:hypothetical protein DSM110093_01297 [Sulfitobacter sp. DSM 110093]|uniref:hypothetical protein n=1 Tax=Sulfitobacter sp. DSM 110093 TaxID=2883127 RepID=UPI001FADA900|nr:hypothetical protein [Sulfitobacter sp. DSM 110093]UOA31528.1 hypothetical protein DSM110093_01297 [Sulfitobacter sp. DSM 110093]
MIGVVLWSDNSAGKAVFWCEDHGDLAYYEEPIVEIGGGSGFDTGDMVQFDISVHRKLRIAGNPRLVQENAGEHLPDALRSDTIPAKALNRTEKSRKTAQIIPFTPKAGQRRLGAAQLKA